MSETITPSQTQITSFPDNEPINLAQVNGSASGIAGNGVVSTGTQRVTLASDSTGQVTLAAGAAVQANAGTGDFLSIAGHTRNEAFKESMAVGGEFDDTGPVDATEGNVSPVRITATRAFHVNLRNSSGTEMGLAATPLAVQGASGNDVGVSGNPVAVGGRASTAIPSAVSGDGDAVWNWLNRSGATVVLMAPHVGLNSDPWNLVHECAQYTGTQTSTVLVAGGASEKIVVTKVQIQVGGTTAGALQLYFGTGAYSRGTSRAIFDGEFAPSTTLKPGVIMDGPFIAGTNGDDLMVTTSAAINPLTINVWYYVVT